MYINFFTCLNASVFLYKNIAQVSNEVMSRQKQAFAVPLQQWQWPTPGHQSQIDCKNFPLTTIYDFENFLSLGTR